MQTAAFVPIVDNSGPGVRSLRCMKVDIGAELTLESTSSQMHVR